METRLSGTRVCACASVRLCMKLVSSLSVVVWIVCGKTGDLLDLLRVPRVSRNGAVGAKNCRSPPLHRDSCPKSSSSDMVFFVRAKWALNRSIKSLTLWEQSLTGVHVRDNTERVLCHRLEPRTANATSSSPHLAIVGVWSWFSGLLRVCWRLSDSSLPVSVSHHINGSRMISSLHLGLPSMRTTGLLRLTATSCTCSTRIIFHLCGSSLWCSGCIALSLSDCSRIAIFSCPAVFLSALCGLHSSLVTAHQVRFPCTADVLST